MGIVNSVIQAGENIKSFELYRPEQGIIDIMQSPELDNLEKLSSSVQVL